MKQHEINDREWIDLLQGKSTQPIDETYQDNIKNLREAVCRYEAEKKPNTDKKRQDSLWGEIEKNIDREKKSNKNTISQFWYLKLWDKFIMSVRHIIFSKENPVFFSPILMAMIGVSLALNILFALDLTISDEKINDIVIEEAIQDRNKSDGLTSVYGHYICSTCTEKNIVSYTQKISHQLIEVGYVITMEKYNNSVYLTINLPKIEKNIETNLLNTILPEYIITLIDGSAKIEIEAKNN